MDWKVTRDTIVDLLPVYLSGEASAATREMVDEFLRRDAELERWVRDDTTRIVLKRMPSSLPMDSERRALERTRRMLQARTWFMASAIFFSLFPFSFVADTEGLRFMVVRDAPGVAVFAWMVAAGMWISYLVNRRSLRTTGI